MKVGDKFKVEYPYKFCQDKGLMGEKIVWWLAGCHLDVEDGCEIMDGVFEKCHNYWCDAIGYVEYEVLAIVPLGGKFTDRAIYRKTYYYPDGRVRKFDLQVMTVNLLESRIKKPFKVDYEVAPSKEAIDDLAK